MKKKTILDEVWDDFPKMTTTEIRGALADFYLQVMMYLKD